MKEYNKFSFFLMVFALVCITTVGIASAAVNGSEHITGSGSGSVNGTNIANNTTANNTNSSNFTGLANSDWPTFQNNNNHTGQSDYTGPQTNTTKWTYDNITVYGSAVIGSDGTLYIGGYDGKLYVFSSSGILQWTWTTRSQIFGSPTIGSDGTIYISNWMNSTTYAISKNGTLLWKHTTGDYNFGSSPVIGTDGTIYIPVTNDINGTLYAINPDGTLKWSYSIGKVYGTSPVIGTDGTIYMADYDGIVYAILPDGTLKWSYTLRYKDEHDVNYYINIYYNTPAIGSDGTIYIASHHGTFISTSTSGPRSEICVLFAVTDTGTIGTAKPLYYVGETIYGAPAITSNGTIYLVSSSKLYAIDSSGKQLWNATGGIFQTALTSAVIASDGTIYFGSSTGLCALKPDGTLKWKYTGSVIGSPAISNNGTLYIGINDIFYAFNDIAVDFTGGNVQGTVLTEQFNGSSTFTPESWKWDFGDGSTSETQNPTHTYAKAGNYTINLAVTLQDGRKITRTKRVAIVEMDITAPTVNASLGGGTYNNTQIVTLTASDDSNNSTIYYTNDGTDPKTSNTREIYTCSLVINDTTTLNFAACDHSGNWSPTSTEKYTIINVIYIQNSSYYNSATINGDIQAILDNSNSGSTVIFLGQAYTGLNLLISKELNILGKSGTIITASSGLPVFLINGPQASGTQINGFTLFNSISPGILVNNTTNVTISNLQVISTGDNAIYINGSSNTSIMDSLLNNSLRGVQVQNSSNTQLNGNTITGNQKDGVNLENSTNTTITGSIISNNGENGVKIYLSPNATINGTNITGNGKNGSDGSGVYADSSDHAYISNSQIIGNCYGISTNNIYGAIIASNTISDNEEDAIALNGKIANTLILSNTLQRNNNGVRINGPDENLTIQTNLITDNIEKGEDRAMSGDGLVFGYNSIYSTSLVVSNNIIHENQHRDVESRYGTQDIEDIVGSNWSGCGCGAPSHDLCGPDCQCKNWDPEMRMVLTRTGDGRFIVQFYDGINTTKLVTGIPSFDVIFTMNGVSQIVQTVNGAATMDYGASELIGEVTATAFEHNASLSWNSPIMGLASGSPEGYTSVNAFGGNNQGGDGQGPASTGENGISGVYGSVSSSGAASGSSSVLGSAPALSAAGTSASSSSASTSGTTASEPKTVQELILDDVNQNLQIGGIIAIIVFILIVVGAYYRKDVKAMIEKSKNK